ncbi:MAG: hypothetical protein H8D38_05490 [DPANN group archaeon]|nr:hypothetical protein [DPANN group archaeon]
MIQTKKGQASFEFLSTYVWVLMGVLVTVGALFYFNVFDPQRYIPEECEFGQNIVCEDWSIGKSTSSTFDIKIKLKNNLERSIETVNVLVFDRDNIELSCSSAKLYCPYTSEDVNWTIATPNQFDGKWSVGKSCRLETNCDKQVIEGAKQSFTITLVFRRQTQNNDATNHTIQGKVFSRVQG